MDNNCRAEFEKHMKSLGWGDWHFGRRPSDEYMHAFVDSQWELWQAARSPAAQPVDMSSKATDQENVSMDQGNIDRSAAQPVDADAQELIDRLNKVDGQYRCLALQAAMMIEHLAEPPIDMTDEEFAEMKRSMLAAADSVTEKYRQAAQPVKGE